MVGRNTVGYGNELPADDRAVRVAGGGRQSAGGADEPDATLQAGPQVSLTWRDNATNETGFVIERSVNGGAFTQIATAPARNNTGNVTYVDTTAVATSTVTTYAYRVAAVNIAGTSAYATSAAVSVPALPAAPTNFTVVNGPNSNNQRSVNLSWIDNSTNETGFTIQRATNASFTGNSVTTVNVAANTTTLSVTGLNRNTTYYFRIRVNNGTFVFTAYVNATPFPITTNP